jgi:Pyruvate/2-oxoacid:ferredoxin oxidoreductase delta subunit
VPGIEFESDGSVRVDEQLMTGQAGVFAGGDMASRERTVTVGVGHGKHAARCVDAWLAGEQYVHPERPGIVTADMLRPWFATDADVREQPRLADEQRASGFEEVTLGLDRTAAVYEAARCLSCGNCFECDGCYGACPESAVVKLGPGRRYRFDLEKCTGCAVCYEQCPCNAIEMIPEPAPAVEV